MTVKSLEYVIDGFDYESIFNSPPEEGDFVFTLGTDLEGVILSHNCRDFIRAKDTIFNSTSPTAWVGRDGSGNQVEFRCRPSTNPYVLVNSIENSLKIYRDWFIAGNSGGLAFGHHRFSIPLGGHIHFGKSPSENLIAKLDYFLAIPILLLSSYRELISRCNGRYGRLSAIENKTYGFEYRTPGNFAINRSLTLEIFVLAGLIADQYKKLHSGHISSKFKKNYYIGNKEYFIKYHLPVIQKELLVSACKRFKNWGWALLQIFRLLTRLNQGECLISSKIEVLKSWNLIPDGFIPKFKIIIGNDDYLSNLKPVLLQNVNPYTKLNGDLLIYGVRDSRASENYQIWVNDSLHNKLVRSIGAENLRKMHALTGKFGTAENYNYSIGLSYKLLKILAEKPNEKISQKWKNIIQEVILKCVA